MVRKLELLHTSLEKSYDDFLDILRVTPKGGAAQDSLSRVNRALQSAMAAVSLSAEELEQGRHFGPF